MNLILKKFNDLTALELYEILKSRSEVFIVEQECPYQDIDDKDKKSYHLYLEEENRVIAYLRIIPPGISYKEASIGRVIVLSEYRNKGLARNLILKAIAFIKNNLDENEIRISAQKYIIRFYESVGFNQITNEYLEDGIVHVGMLYKEKNL